MNPPDPPVAAPPRRRRLSSRVRALILLVVIAGIGLLYVKKIEGRMPDYEVYRRAAIRARHAEQLYRPTDGHYQFKYLPAFAVVTLPLGMAPDRVVRVVWFAGSILLLILLLRRSVAVLPEARRTRAFLIGATFVLLAKFFAHEIELGQVNILMATLVVLAVQQLSLGRELGAGLLIAAAVVVKPYSVLFIPYLAARRRLAALVGVVGGMVAALLLPAVVYGFDGNVRLLHDWWRTVTDTTAPNLADINNVSAASVFSRWLGPGPTAQLLATITVAALLIVAGVVFLRRKSIRFPEGLEIALLLTMIPILSPQGWDYVFLLSTLATMYLVNYADALPRYVKPVVITALVVAGFTIFDLVGRTIYQHAMRASVIPICYLVIIAGLAVLRMRKVA